MSNPSTSVWSSIKRLLVVVKCNELESMNHWRESIKLSGLNIHDCKIMGIVETKKERIGLSEMTSVVYISEKDFGFFGGLKNEDAQRTFNDPFDAVLVVGEIPKRIEKMVQKISTNIDIGLNTENENQTINLHTEESAPKYMLNFVKQTLEKIS